MTRIAPHRLPLLPEYKSNTFKKATRLQKPVVEALLFREPKFEKKLQDLWVAYQPHAKLKNRKKQYAHWRPKLYACVGASSYWPFIIRAIKKLKKSPTPWKFFMAPAGYERPDKVVFYFKSETQLRRFVKILRRLMPRSGLHTLRHAASTTQMDIEGSRHRGIYVGIDPPIHWHNWRLYRCICLAWGDLNERYLQRLPGGRKRWLERMNLSTRHEGPHSLSPDPRNIPYIRRYWRMIAGAQRLVSFLAV